MSTSFSFPIHLLMRLFTAHTYRLASVLPSLILDTLLTIPYWLIAMRNALLPTQPFVRPPPTLDPVIEPQAELHLESEAEDGNESGSEADVESNSGEGPTASWVRLKKSASEEASA